MSHPNREEVIYPNIVYYNDDHSKTQACTSTIRECLKLTFTTPSTWQELAKELEAGAEFLAFHVDMMERSIHSTPIEFIDAITIMAKFIQNNAPLKIAVIITPNTPLSMIRTLQKAGVQGLLLDFNHYAIEETIAGANAHINNIPYWPKHVLDKLPGNPQKAPNADRITLTHRQEEVFRFITQRGSSNKVIAKALGISESTVKLHVTEIFKKYGVRSRTQLAVFSNVS